MIHSFLLIGQSNMAGRGFLKDVAPIKDPGIRMLRNGRWQVMSEPINYDRVFAGIGPAASFAAAWRRKHPTEEIGLIPCADGGSSLAEWVPGGVLFDHAVMQAKLASRTSQIDGILWHQGETDCAPERAVDYEKRLGEMMTALRAELQLPDVPILIGGLGDFLAKCPLHDYFCNAPQMNRQLKDFAEKNENCYFVTAKGLSSNPDLLHFNAVSQRLFGFRYFTAYDERRHVYDVLPDEADLRADEKEYVEQPPEKKIEWMKEALEAGTITKQEYDFRMDALISMM